MPKVSVIVPIYNAQDYLHRCVDSILAQTFADFELLLVDDGSTDSSGIICDNYASGDCRAKVFHKENGGVSSARNVGLKNATGEWVCFVDSDDTVHQDYLNNLVSATNENVEMVISFAVSVFMDKIVEPTYRDAILIGKDFAKLFNEYDLHWRTSPWAKLYKRKIVENNNLLFNLEMPIGEDLVFLYEYIRLVQCLAVSGKTYYYYSAEVQSQENYNYFLNSGFNVIIKDNKIDIKDGRHPVVEKVLKGQLFIPNGETEILVDDKLIRDTDALARLEYTKYSYINRTLNSVYHNSCPIRERIDWLKKIHYKPFLNYLASNRKTIREFLSYFLIKHRMLVLYDFIRILNDWFKIGRLK